MTDYDIEDGGLKVEDGPAYVVGIPYGNPGIAKVHDELATRSSGAGGSQSPFSSDGNAGSGAPPFAQTNTTEADPDPAECVQGCDPDFTKVGEDYPTPTADDNWQARETRRQAISLAAEIYRGREVSDIIDGAKMIEAYIEDGEVPDFTY